MTTVLFYLVVAAVIGLVVFFLAVFVFGRGEQMAPLDPRTSPAELPDHDITADDVRRIRFALALRGYRMSDVDWTLEKLGEQIDSLRRENAELRGLTPSDVGAEPHPRVEADSLAPVGAPTRPEGSTDQDVQPYRDSRPPESS
ncbi:DivIVA domain-containing protein [Nakamurella panacisegetis]|uniref:DivIVA domain-containing protein n=1 Tax=Nakamurella panacisegetis TaxID=1090615 RepID=UPI000B8229AF|nr:DivIVA domain-containing protein [Nakamurella panacisegetis]